MADAEISKNAAKKAAKAAEAAAKKAEKDAAKAAAEAAAPKKEKLGEEVEELDPTKYYENRLTQLKGFEVRSKRSFCAPVTHPLLSGSTQFWFWCTDLEKKALEPSN